MDRGRQLLGGAGNGLGRADTVVWFDLPYAVVMARTIRRTVRRVVTRQELWNGNKEPWSNLYSFDPKKSIIAWAATRHRSTVDATGRPSTTRAGRAAVRAAALAAGGRCVPRRGDGHWVDKGVTDGSGTGRQAFLITGGTDGLGLALAEQLAAEGAAVGVWGATRSGCAPPSGAMQARSATCWPNGETCHAPRTSRRLRRPPSPDGVVSTGSSTTRGAPPEAPSRRSTTAPGSPTSSSTMAPSGSPGWRSRAAGRRGAILFTLAISAKAPGASSEPSSVTRAAGMALMKALSKELAPTASGSTPSSSGSSRVGMGPVGRRLRDRASRILDRFAETPAFPSAVSAGREFADLGCFLLSSRASYLTGTAINLDGGLSPSV